MDCETDQFRITSTGRSTPNFYGKRRRGRRRRKRKRRRRGVGRGKEISYTNGERGRKGRRYLEERKDVSENRIFRYMGEPIKRRRRNRRRRRKRRRRWRRRRKRMRRKRRVTIVGSVAQVIGAAVVRSRKSQVY